MQEIMEKITDFSEQAAQFFREVKVELQKVTFPTRQETVGSTVVVLVLTVIMSPLPWVLVTGPCRIVQFF